MFQRMKVFFARKLLEQLIGIAVDSIYSEQFDFDSLVERLSRKKPGTALLRAYVAIRSAAELTEPLDAASLDSAFSGFRASEQRAECPEFQSILDIHRELADMLLLWKHAENLRGKLAHQIDEYSYEGTVYDLEHERKRPSTKAERANFQSICSKIAEVNRQLEQAELGALKKKDETEYQRYRDELETRELRSEVQRNEADAEKCEMLRLVGRLEAALDALLRNTE